MAGYLCVGEPVTEIPASDGGVAWPFRTVTGIAVGDQLVGADGAVPLPADVGASQVDDRTLVGVAASGEVLLRRIPEPGAAEGWQLADV